MSLGIIPKSTGQTPFACSNPCEVSRHRRSSSRWIGVGRLTVCMYRSLLFVAALGSLVGTRPLVAVSWIACAMHASAAPGQSAAVEVVVDVIHQFKDLPQRRPANLDVGPTYSLRSKARG